MPNPLTGPAEAIAGFFGLLVGGGVFFVSDRYWSTRSMTLASGATDPSAPTYNSFAPDAPIWSSWKRAANALGNVIVPFVAAGMVKKNAWKGFFQIWGAGATTMVLVKAGSDAATLALKSSPAAQRLLAPEVNGQNLLAAANAPAPGGPGTAGLPFRTG